MNDATTLSVREIVEYCRTQAALLSGRVETIGEETDVLLDEIDEDIAEIRARLTKHSGGAKSPAMSPSVEPNDETGEIMELEALETELEEKQAIAEAKQARRAAFRDLAATYIDLADELERTADDGKEALDRVLRFERDHDAPAYFDDRQTLLEAATESDGSSGE